MTQSVVIQVGQCGNQIGCCFWDLALREHAAVNQKAIYDEAISSFFRNVDTRVVGDGGSISKGKIYSLKARGCGSQSVWQSLSGTDSRETQKVSRAL